MPSAFEQAVLDGIVLLRGLPRGHTQGGQARQCFVAFRDTHPDVDAELVTDWSSASTRMDYDLLLRDDAHGTVALSQVPVSGSPWSVEHAEHWAAQRVLTVDGQVLTVHDALRLWQARALEGPGVMDELLADALIAGELDDDGFVSPEVLQKTADAVRRRLGLGDRAHTLRWLDEHGLTLSGFERLARREAQREMWLERKFAVDGAAYFERHPDDFERFDVCYAHAAASVLEDLRAAVRSGASLLAAIDQHLRAQSPPPVEAKVERRFSWQLPRALRGAATSQLVGSSDGEDPAWLAQMLARSASTFDEGVRRSVRARLFDRWLVSARAAAEVHWHWL